MGRYWETVKFRDAFAPGLGADDVADALGMTIVEVFDEYGQLSITCDFEHIGKVFCKVVQSYETHAVPANEQYYTIPDNDTLQKHIEALTAYYAEPEELSMLYIELAVLNELLDCHECIMTVEY